MWWWINIMYKTVCPTKKFHPQNPSVQSAPVKPTASSKTLETHVPTTPHTAWFSSGDRQPTSDARFLEGSYVGKSCLHKVCTWCWNILKDSQIVWLHHPASVLVNFSFKKPSPFVSRIVAPVVRFTWASRLAVNHQSEHQISPGAPGECLEMQHTEIPQCPASFQEVWEPLEGLCIAHA